MCIDESYEDKELVGVVRCAARVIRHGRVDMLFSDRHGAPSVSWLLLWTVAEGTLMRRRDSPPSFLAPPPHSINRLHATLKICIL